MRTKRSKNLAVRIFDKIDMFFYRLCKMPRNILSWIRLRTTNRQHVLNLGLKPGWYDIDMKLIHANFELLKQYVEIEKPFEMIDWNSDGGHKHAAREIRELYTWWLYIRPYREEKEPCFQHKGLDMDFVKSPGSKTTQIVWLGTKEEQEDWTRALEQQSELELKWMEEDTANLKRLIDIRKYLWT